VCHPLAAYESSPFWTADPKKTPYRDCMKNMTPNGYAGTLGYASAAAQADFIIPNMVAEAASGSKTPKEAAERAQKRAERYYKVNAAVLGHRRAPAARCSIHRGGRPKLCNQTRSRALTVERSRGAVHVPAAALLLLFPTYPLGRDVSQLYGRKDRLPGSGSAWVRTWRATPSLVVPTLFYTIVACVKVRLGLGSRCC
jgi:hypothetical protein